jgi:hypothetical protein
MDTQQHEEGETPKDDLMVGKGPIKAFCVDDLGLPGTTDPYYLKKRGWPIGNLHGERGTLVASKRRLIRYMRQRATA